MQTLDSNQIFSRGLDESHFRKLFVRRNVLLLRKRELERSRARDPGPRCDPGPADDPDPVPVDEAKGYDYNNENDASYCPNNVPVSAITTGIIVKNSIVW